MSVAANRYSSRCENEAKLTHERLLEVLAYNPETGIFTHRKDRGSAKAGDVAGVVLNDGSRRIKIDGANYNSLRLSWLYTHGSWPQGAAIPIDGNLDNARISNVRVVPEILPDELPTRKGDLTVKLIQRLFDYNPLTGQLFWAVQCYRVARIRFGQLAGSINDQGYLVICIGGIDYRAHRLAYAHHYGEWPKDQIDHRNGVRSANHIANLRPATNAQNVANQRTRKDNTSGFRGVYRMKEGSFRVHCNGKHIGTFKAFEDAVHARLKAEAEIRGLTPIVRGVWAILINIQPTALQR